VLHLVGGPDNKDTNQYWLIRDIANILVAYFIAVILVRYIENQILGLKVDLNLAPCTYLFNRIIYAMVLSLLPILIVTRYYNGIPADIGLNLISFKKNIIIGIIAGLTVLVVVSLVHIGFTSIFGEGHDYSQVQKLKMTKNPISFIVGSLSSVLLAPLSEEIYCRGFAYTIFKKHYGKIVGVMLSSFLYAGLHFDMWNTFSFIILGVVFALLFESTNSLVPGITAHTVINLSTVVLIMIG
jgi:membrane protease YdiL (CAAX protease family)